MLKMFRRKRRERGEPRDRHHDTDASQHKDGEHAHGVDKTDGDAFQVLPAIKTGRSMLRPSYAPVDLESDNSTGSHSTLGDGNSNSTFVSFITFKDAVDLQSPTAALHGQPAAPALVYIAGGKAKSMYTVTRPASVRKFRESAISQTSPICSPISAVPPPLPTLKLPSVKARHKQSPTFNLCVAGAPSSGKSSFIRMLCETLDVVDKAKDGNRDFSLVKAGVSEPASITITTNTAFSQRIRLTLFEADSFSFGYDTSQNLHSDLKVNELVHFIEDRLDASIAQERALVRQPLTSADSHVHACLYFLDQSCFTRAKPTSQIEGTKVSEANETVLNVSTHHLNVMQQIGKRVDIIPIIARADELSIVQVEEMKFVLNELSSSGTVLNPEIFAQNSNLEIEGYDLIGRLAMSEPVDNEEGETEEESIPITPIIRSRSNSVHRRLPRRKNKRFSAIAIKPPKEEINKIFPTSLISPESFDLPNLPNESAHEEIQPLIRFRRDFRYGCVNIENEEHCEFMGLKKVLFTTGWKTLKDSTEIKFERYRTERLEQRQARSRANTSITPAL